MDQQLKSETEESLTDWLNEKRGLTPELLNDMCLTYRHDFGLLSEEEQQKLRIECRRWFETFKRYMQWND